MQHYQPENSFWGLKWFNRLCFYHLFFLNSIFWRWINALVDVVAFPTLDSFMISAVYCLIIIVLFSTFFQSMLYTYHQISSPSHKMLSTLCIGDYVKYIFAIDPCYYQLNLAIFWLASIFSYDHPIYLAVYMLWDCLWKLLLQVNFRCIFSHSAFPFMAKTNKWDKIICEIRLSQTWF